MPAVLALPDIGLLLAGLLLAFLAFALWGLRDLLTGAFSHVPVIGGFIGRSLGSLLDSARRDVLSASHSSLSGATRLFRWVSGWMGHVLTGIGHTFTAIATTIDHLVRVQVPHLFDVARHETAVLFDGLRHDAARWVADARHQAAVEFDGLRHDTLAWIDDVRFYVDRQVAASRAYAASLFARAETDVASALADARAFAAAETGALARAVAGDLNALATETGTLFRTAERDAAAGIAAAETAASVALVDAVKGIVTDLDTWGNEAVTRAWPDVQGDLDALGRLLGRDFPDIGKLIPALEGAGAAGLLGALIRSLAGSAVAVRALEDCVIPNCRNLSQLGKDLSELGSAVSAAAMVAWMAYIAADPVAAADETVAVCEPFIGSVFDPLTSLLSAGIEHL